MDSFVYDEINSIKNLIMMSKSKIRRHAVKKEFILFVDSSAPSRYFSAAYALLTKAVDSTILHIVYTEETSKSFLEDFFSYVSPQYKGDKALLKDTFPRVHFYDSVNEFLDSDVKFRYKNLYFCTFLDSQNDGFRDGDSKSKYLQSLADIICFANSSDKKNISFLHYSVIPEIVDLPGSLESISEREYEVYASQFGEDSAEKFVLSAEEVLRNNFDDRVNMVAVRITNIFGPGISNKYIDEVLAQVRNKAFVLEATRARERIDLNYIRYASTAVFFMSHRGEKGNIYNLKQFTKTPYELVTEAYDCLMDLDFDLKSESQGQVEEKFRLLCSKKVNTIIPAKYTEMKSEDCLYRTLVSSIGIEFTDRSINKKYDGKLDEIKAIEMEMIKEIKRICEKHNIKYFLVGGSLLGAVRHGGFIPWDDDLDIGMLREDYDKFRKVAPDELSEEYTYQSYEHEPDSHYIFDKIRLKDTFFTTKFSDRFKMQNGLFIDILVYDKTSEKPKYQKMHITLLRWMTRLINIRWVNVPRKGIAYRFSKIMLPFMRLFPLSFYHKVFNIILKWFKKTQSHYLIDGVGLNIERGAFTDSWFDEIVEIPYEDILLPVPSGYDSYLRHWYGDKYMELPPVSVRNSGHDLRRVDLGKYLVNFGFSEGEYHKASIKGELYDKKQ